MNILSLFDGMSCGQLALNRANIKYEKYFASEIDKYTVKVTQENYPNTIQLGDITKIKSKDLPKIDLLMGGSPCQGFSFAGKGLNFNDPRSKLFFEYVRLFRELQPKYFLFENVRMKKEYQKVITDHFKIEPIIINSSLVSAQNRIRLYWTNIPNITQPSDKQLLLKDIIENGSVDRGKSFCIDANYSRGGNLKRYFQRHSRQLVFSPSGLCQIGSLYKNNGDAGRIYSVKGKARTLKGDAGGGGGGAKMGLISVDNIKYRKLTPIECERLQTVPDNYTNYVSNAQRYKMLGNGWTVDVIAHILKCGIKRIKE